MKVILINGSPAVTIEDNDLEETLAHLQETLPQARIMVVDSIDEVPNQINHLDGKGQVAL